MTVANLLDEIENKTLYLALVTVDRCTLQIVLLKMQGYSTKEIAPLVHLTAVEQLLFLQYFSWHYLLCYLWEVHAGAV